jgi:hypothetical protein
MGQLLKGKPLDAVRKELEDEVRETVNSDTMNYLAYLNYIVEVNKKYSFGKPWENPRYYF